ncbi:hypothetical protein [Streptomyces sp. NBC_01760]|uniref:hypothetical protein n=1 Tax=Streptomyces sp. NBC_01760 TaxID=2975931 RepID=UPI002DDA5F29|nr:hypothetical protein [Streptomyces sp. NBC_01760]WSC72184.1 hypothetical protein OG807_28960 [Streptomyces sp. NBC_01760]
MFTRRSADDQLLTEARRRIATMTPQTAREYSITVWAYGMRIAENPSKHIEDDLGEWDMALAALQAIRERLA